MLSVEAGDEGWVYAVEIVPRFIEHINADAIRFELNNITGVLCAKNSVNLPSDSVDVVFVCDTYHHFEYPKSTLASIHRALKPDGHLVVVDSERIEGTSREWTMGHVRAGKEVFSAEILDAGFVLDEEKMIDGFEENYFLRFSKEQEWGFLAANTFIGLRHREAGVHIRRSILPVQTYTDSFEC